MMFQPWPVIDLLRDDGWASNTEAGFEMSKSWFIGLAPLLLLPLQG